MNKNAWKLPLRAWVITLLSLDLASQSDHRGYTITWLILGAMWALIAIGDTREYYAKKETSK